MLFESEYATISQPTEGEFRDRGSRFLSFAFPVKDETTIKALVNKIRKEHPKANHHCYAYRLGPGKLIFRFSDDREPSGTAGKPIFGVIQSHDLTDILIVVARYFGGSLLGVPGLIHAYKEAALDAITNAKIISLPITEKYQLVFGYELLKELTNFVRHSKAVIISQRMTDKCTLTIEIDRSNADAFYSDLINHHSFRNKCEITVL